jgi:putative hemolysin
VLEIIIILICLLLNALLAGSETALIALNKASLRAQAKEGVERAKLLLQLRENPERTLSVIQVGITFVGAFAAAVGGAGAEEAIAPWIHQRFGLGEPISEFLAVFSVVIPLTYASVTLGELVPKTLALRRPMFVASKAAPWLLLVSRMIDPVVTLLESSTRRIIEFFPKKHTQAEEASEFSFAIESMSPVNRQYIMNMVKIESTTVREIYIKWSEVIFVDATDSIEKVENTIISSGHTRLPVVKGGKVIGILNSKEFLAFRKTGRSDWANLYRPSLSVQEITPILTALRSLQEKRAHMAIVYSGAMVAGIVTMEAIFEEIIGDIYDEDDDGAIKKILSQQKFIPPSSV